MKNFFIAYKNQIKNNHIVTALEFLYPNHLESFTESNTSHFGAWEFISAIAEINLKKGFNTKNFLDILETFEKTYLTKTKAKVMSCEYNSIKELEEFCVTKNYALISGDDFFYPKNDKLISINGEEIKGNFLLLEQSNI